MTMMSAEATDLCIEAQQESSAKSLPAARLTGSGRSPSLGMASSVSLPPTRPSLASLPDRDRKPLQHFLLFPA